MSDSGSGGRALPSKRRMALGLVVLVVVLVGIGVVLGVFGAPSVNGVENRFGGVNETSTEIETNISASNPNPFGARFGGATVNYTVTMNEITMAHGTKSGVGLATGNSTLALTTLLVNERIPDWWVSHIRNGERTTVRVNADVCSATLGQSVSVTPVEREIGTDLLSSFASDEPRPITTDAPVGNPVLVIEETRTAWGSVSEAETPVQMEFVLRNPNAYPVVISQIRYDAMTNDVAVGEGETESGIAIPPGETRTVEARAVIENQHLDEWWVTHIERNQVSTLRIQFYLTLDLSAVGAGDVRIPLRPMTTPVETDIFGNKPTASPAPEMPSAGEMPTERPGGSNAEPSPTETTTSTPNGSGSSPSAPTSPPTDTPAGAPTETPTPTLTETTETDDGGGLPLP